MMKLIPLPLRQYAQFNGRMTRSRFLRWLALVMLIFYICGWIDIGLIAPKLGYLPFEDVKERYATTVAGALLVTPLLTSNIRRLHDLNHTGWWMLLAIPMMAIFYFSAEIGFAIYQFLASGSESGLVAAGWAESAIIWMPWLIAGLAALSFSPVIYWSLKKGTNEPNRFGTRE